MLRTYISTLTLFAVFSWLYPVVALTTNSVSTDAAYLALSNTTALVVRHGDSKARIIGRLRTYKKNNTGTVLIVR